MCGVSICLNANLHYTMLKLSVLILYSFCKLISNITTIETKSQTIIKTINAIKTAVIMSGMINLFQDTYEIEDTIKMSWKVILLIGVLWIIFKKWQKRRLYRLSNKLKTDLKKYPFIGHAYLVIGSEEERLKAIEMIGRDSIKHDGMSSFWLGGNYNIVVSDADVLKLVLRECLEKNGVVLFARNLVGNGSAVAPVPIWRPRRKILTPTFHHKYLNQFISVFAKHSRIFIEELIKVSDSDSISVAKYASTFAMGVVCQTTFGIHVNSERGKDEPFLKAFNECMRLLTQRMVQPWLHALSLYKLLPMYTEFMKNKSTLTDFIKEAIITKRESMRKEGSSIKQTKDNEPNEMKTSLDVLIELSGDVNGYTDVELEEETMVLVLAGIDTTTVGISFTAMMLARHMDVQEKVYQELQHVFGDTDREIMFEDLLHLKYLGAVIKECLRLYPPLPVIARKIEKDIKIPSGLTLVKGCGIAVHIWALHRNPRYWGNNAEIFKPERFLEPLKYPNAFIPFSNGSRSCVGYEYAMMSMKTLFTFLLRKYRLLPVEHDTANGITPAGNEPVRPIFDITMKPVEKFTIKLERRNK